MRRSRDGWATGLPASFGDRVRALAMPLLLAGIAALGVQRSATLQQSSWQGASFGMFATYDGPSRTVAVEVTGPDGPYRVLLPPELRDDALRLEVVPTEEAADALAEAVLDRVADDGGTSVEVVVRRLAIRRLDGGEVRLRIEPIVTGSSR